MVGDLAKVRLDRLDVMHDGLQVARSTAVRVVGSCCDTLNERADRCAQQDDRVEIRKELDHVVLASGEEENLYVLHSEEVSNRVLAPSLPSIRERLCVAVVGVDGLVATMGECSRDRRLAGPGHPGEKDAPRAPSLLAHRQGSLSRKLHDRHRSHRPGSTSIQSACSADASGRTVTSPAMTS